MHIPLLPTAPQKPWHATTLAITDLINQAITTRPDKPRPYLGGSRIGVECWRALGFEYHKYPNPIDGKLQRIFDFGHTLEPLMVQWLEEAGFVLQYTNENQLGFSIADGKIRGHLDGVIVDGPAIPGMSYPCLVEFKTMNDKQFKITANLGCEEAKPVYYVQQQVYMAYAPEHELWKNPSLFVAVNKNDSTPHFELVAFNQNSAQDNSDKAFAIISAEHPEDLPRITDDPSFFKCKFCSYHKACFSL